MPNANTNFAHNPNLHPTAGAESTMPINDVGGVGSFFSDGLQNSIFGAQSNQPILAGKTVNTVLFAKFQLGNTWTISRNAFIAVIASGTAHAGFGVYNSSGTTKIIDTGAVAITGASNTAYVTTFSPVTLNAGVYIFAWTADSTSANVNASHNGLAAGGGTTYSINTPNVGTAQNASVAGALPAALGTLTADIFNVPLVLWDRQ